MAGNRTLHGRVLLVAGLAAASAAAVLHTGTLLEPGFGRALEATRQLSFEGTAAPRGRTTGDEGFWLTRAEVESPSPFAKALAVGDRITIAGGDGGERHLEVVDIKSIGGAAQRADGRAGGGPRLLLVTCRVAGEAGGAPPVRFIIEAEAPPAPSKPAPAKAL